MYDITNQTYIRHLTLDIINISDTRCLTSEIIPLTFDINHILDIWHLKPQIIQILCRYQTSYIRRHRSDVWHETSYICHTSDVWYQICVLVTSDDWHQTYIRHQMSDIRCLTKNIRYQTSYMRRLIQILDIRHQTSDIWRPMSDVRHLMCDKCMISDVRHLRSDISMMSHVRHQTSDTRHLTLYTSDVWLLTWDTWHQTYHNICHQTGVLVACLTSNVWWQTSDVTS